MIGTAYAFIKKIFRRGKLFGRLCLFVMIAATAFALNPPSVEQVAGEYEVKAAYLFNFAKFVEWPASVFPSNKSSIIIGIAGDDPFGPVLEKTVLSKTVQNRNIGIYRLKKPEDWRSCHIIFISSAANSFAIPAFESLESHHVLTVCEKEGPVRSKCIINFVMEGERVQFEVDAIKAERTGIKISSKLMMIGRVLNAGAIKGRN
jgi:hypothetical protein